MSKKSISKHEFQKITEFMQSKARNLEKTYFEYLFLSGNPKLVIAELEKFQNSDGGFGNGIEPDFWLPNSSPLATSFAFQTISKLPENIAESLIKRGIEYFENTFDENRNGWFTMPEKVNNYPHAPWWNYLQEINGTVIDESWGNPTVEIVGYLFKYKKFVKNLDLGKLLQLSLEYLNSKTEFESENEIFCFQRLVKNLPENVAKNFHPKIRESVFQLVKTDKNLWNTHVPRPLDFVKSPNHFLYQYLKEVVTENLDYLTETLTQEGFWNPLWSWGEPEEWKIAKQNWRGILTIENLQILNNFNLLVR